MLSVVEAFSVADHPATPLGRHPLAAEALAEAQGLPTAIRSG